MLIVQYLALGLINSCFDGSDRHILGFAAKMSDPLSFIIYQ
ncbi:MAG: hypothetical protein ACFCU7_00855 [Pleurocapsa sp.]